MKQLYKRLAAVLFTGCFACTPGDTGLHLAGVCTVIRQAAMLRQVRHKPSTAGLTITTPAAAPGRYSTTGMLPAEKLAALILFQ